MLKLSRRPKNPAASSRPARLRGLPLLLACTVAAASQARAGADATDQEPAPTLRLLLLDLRPAATVPAIDDEKRALLEGLIDEALRNREGALWITGADVRARAPMEADRLPTCADPACLFELASVVDADFVLLPIVTEWSAGEEGLRAALAFSLFDRVRADVVRSERLPPSAPDQLADRLRPLLTRVLAPAFAGQTRQKWQAPLFLTGAGIAAAALATTAGALGYAAELEAALARPAVHRSLKERALAEGPAVLSLASGAGAIALTGALLMGVSWLTDNPATSPAAE